MTMKIGCCVNFLPKEPDDPGTCYAKAIKNAGYDYEQAFAQLIQLCKELGDAAGERGITLALEPNNRTETNMLNTFSDVVTLAKAAPPNIRCLQDYYHLKIENDTVDSLLEYGNEFLVHSHFARLEGRGFPKDWTEDEYYPIYFKALKTIGYKGGVSMEGSPVNRDSFAEKAKATCSFLREAAR
ncbi:MAG: sugar phosphate isomerase/epimerase [Dorea sp.]|jgi:D-psicose/D-tagatose/L-ribulose 3-epimerase|nr:sugar phosphate isomerase/epimerase [Dorea sp.]